MSNSEEAVGRIAALARSGQLDAAAIQVVDALARNPGDPVLSALGGAVEFHRGQFRRAIPYLEEAFQHKPNDLTIRINLAESHFHEGNQAEALRLCDEAIALADPSLRLARLGAHLAQELENFPLAVRLYRHLVKHDAKDWSLWNNLGNALGFAGDHDSAVEALQKALALAPDSQPIRINLGNALIDAGLGDEAEAVLTQAGKDFPSDPTPFLSLFNLYRLVGREDDAYAAIVEAARRAPDNASIQSDHGQEAARRNRYDEAESAFEAAVRLDPKLGPPYVGLASVYERMNRETELEPLRIRAEAAGTDVQSMSYIDALRFKRAEAFDDAFAALEAAGDVIVPGRKHHLRGIMLDRLGQHDDAFEAFTAMNEHWQADPSLPAERARQYREMIVSASEVLTSEWLQRWTPQVPLEDRPTPIFIVGFPRSGTTLLDTMLMADPRVRVLEEEPFLAEAEAQLGGVEALAAATEDQIRAAREGYFERAASISKLEPDSIIVDKHPMHLNKVPVALRLFPDARFVLAMRHPCDVLLSCYITNFRINAAMANFLDLDDAATLYDLTFSHWEKARGLFDMPVATIVYERLVEDTQGQLEPVFDWLGLQWPGKAFDHTKAARARGTVATASYAQVTEPIYSRAKGRWTKYRRHLERIHPVLAPWIERYGYDF
ncbi:MAG: sulfotransferase [Sphingomonadaceae bacterium]